MTLSMHRASVPVLARALRNLAGVLRKGEAFAAAKKIDQKVMLDYRLAPDMFPLARQVQIATDMAKGCVARLAGVEIPVYEDKEASFGELIARIEKCVAFLESLGPERIDGSEDKTVVLKRASGDITYQGLPYLLEYAQPQVYFHCVTAYAILRHCGVEIGKKDYIG